MDAVVVSSRAGGLRATCVEQQVTKGHLVLCLPVFSPCQHKCYVVLGHTRTHTLLRAICNDQPVCLSLACLCCFFPPFRLTCNNTTV